MEGGPYARHWNSQVRPVAAAASIEPLNMDDFNMEQSPHGRDHRNSQGSPTSQGAIQNSPFGDFTQPFQDLAYNPTIDSPIETQMERPDPYNHPTRGSFSERGASVTSAAGLATRGSFSSNTPYVQGQGESQDGSDGPSPESNRVSRASVGDGYADEFGQNGSGAADGSDLGSKSKADKDDPTPAWSELKTKAGKERKRLPLACIACRRKKIRCSGEKPACKHCLRSRIPCVYKVTTRKAAPRTDYMAMLDKRLKRMEERIIRIVPKEEQDLSTMTRAQVKPAIPGTAPVRTAKKRPAEDAFGPELDAWAKSNVTGEESIPNSLMAQEAQESRLLTDGANALPSRDIQEHLAEVFFEHLYGQAYHLLHKPSFMRKLKAGTVPPVLILAVCAVSARFSTHPKLNTSPEFLRGEPWAAEARDIVMKRYEWPNITILTCLLLLGLHEFGTCYGGRSWALGGMAVRMAYALQLHRDLDHDPSKRPGTVQLSFIDREIRRRTMWACFLMDRFNSSGTDRPMFMKEETIKVQLPIKESLFQLDIEGPTEDMNGNVPYPVAPDTGQLSDAKQNMGVAAYMIRSLALWGRIIIYHFQGGREMDPYPIWSLEAQFVDLEHRTDEIVTSLPDALKYSIENVNTHETEGLANQFLFLHITIQQNILFLNHNAVHGYPGGRPPKDIPREFASKATAKAFEAANRISSLLRDAESHRVTAPFAGYCAFLSSTVQMTAAFSKNPVTEAKAKKNLATNVRYLTKMKRYWGAFHWTSENLKEQFRSCADAAKRGTATPGSLESPSGVFQYSDWFDRYPHGVSQSDFEDPDATIKIEQGDDAVLEQKSGYHTVEEFITALSPVAATARDQTKPKRKNTRKQSQAPPPPQQPQQQLESQLTHAALADVTPMQLPTHQITQNFQLSPEAANFYQHPNSYNQEMLFHPQQQSIVPQLDRQLVFGAYAGSVMDPTAIGTHSLLDPLDNSWDMNMGMGMSGFEPTSAWFMPFNMEPPDLGTDSGDIFGDLGTQAGMGYGMDMGLGLPVNNLGTGNGGGMDGTGGGS